MIFVTLGTQDKPFTRLLDYLEKSNIKEEIIVQAGYTKYSSSKMKIFSYLNKEDFDRYIKEADYIICHSGVGTIINSLKHEKKVLLIPRLAKYGEHHNDHQIQIAEVYRQKGYVIVKNEEDSMDEKFEELRKFKPEKFVSNNENFVGKLRDYILLENN